LTEPPSKIFQFMDLMQIHCVTVSGEPVVVSRES